MAAGMVVNPDEGFEQGEFGLGHLQTRSERWHVLVGDIVVTVSDEIFKSMSLQQSQVQLGSCLCVLVIFWLEGEGSNCADEGDQATVAIPREDGLSYVPLVLLVQRLAMLNRRKRPFVDVEFEIGYDSRRLAALPVDEV